MFDGHYIAAGTKLSRIDPDVAELVAQYPEHFKL
jgi:hypothetical protein